MLNYYNATPCCMPEGVSCGECPAGYSPKDCPYYDESKTEVQKSIELSKKWIGIRPLNNRRSIRK